MKSLLAPSVLLCSTLVLLPHCRESYNAALRATRAGFGNVYWYRGGMAAWDAARLPEM